MKTTTPQKTRSAKTKILRVWIEHRPDESPDTSWLGEYTDEPKGWRWDRSSGCLLDEQGKLLACDNGRNWERGEFKFIHGFQNGNPDSWSHVSDADVAKAFLSCRYRANGNEQGFRGNLFKEFNVTGWQSARTRADKVRLLDVVYCCLNAYRLERLQRGDWHFIGIIAKAEIWNPDTQVTQTIHSGGLWGVESDSGEDYLKEVAGEELSQLRTELQALGIGARAIDYAFKHVTTPD